MSDNGTLRIVYLQAENVKRLKAVRIRPDKTLVRIEGRNAQGKSSVLDAIAAALGGGKWNPDKPIREGTKNASVVVDLDEIIVERRWTAQGSYLSVTAKDGAKIGSPQAVLDKLVGDLTFDPLAFVRMKPTEQVAVLKRLAGLDFDKLEAERNQVFEERTIVNREAKAATARAGVRVPKPKSPKPIDMNNVAAEYQEALRHNATVVDAKRKADDAHDKAEECGARLTALQTQLVELQEEFRTLAKASKDSLSVFGDMKERQVGDLQKEMADAEAVNASIAAYESYQEKHKEADAKSAEADALTTRIEAIDDEKDNLLRAAKFPLPGLSFNTDGVSFNDIPLTQASSAEQLRVGVAMGLAQQPRARIMLCRDGSLLDRDSMKTLHAIAEEYDAQIFVERVAEEASPSAVYIEDGEVVSA